MTWYLPQDELISLLSGFWMAVNRLFSMYILVLDCHVTHVLWSWRVCCALSRSPMTWHGVTQRGRMPTPSSPTTTIRTLTTIAPGTMGCLRTSPARANRRPLSWWHQKIKAVCVQINYRALAFASLLCCHQWKATAKVEHQTRAANKALVRTVFRHKSDTAFRFSLWTPLIFVQLHTNTSLCFQDWFSVHDHKERQEDRMSTWSSLYSDYLFIKLRFILFVSSPPSIPSWKTLCTMTCRYTLCHYLKRYYYLLYMFYIVYKMRILTVISLMLHPSDIQGGLFRLYCMTLA